MEHKIIELKIDEEYGEVDAIALVARPAIEEDYYAFNSHYFASYSDYPKAVSATAARGIKLNEAVNNKCATRVGKIRAKQLADGKPISEETIKRMYAYLSRAEEYYNPNDTEACGTISYLLWGGEPALKWSERKLAQLEKEREMSMANEVEDSSYAFAVALYEEMFATENEKEAKQKKRIISPIMIPNKLILRLDEDNEEYYVYFSEETIEKIAHKFITEGRTKSINYEHNEEEIIDGVSLVESWVIEDSKTDKSTSYNMSYPKGTWMGIYQFNDVAWNDYVENGLTKGVSVEGTFISKILGI